HQQLAMQAVIEHSGELFRSVRIGKVGTTNVANEQRVAGEHTPGLRLALRIVHGKAHALWSMPGRFQDTDAALAEADFIAITQWDVGKLCACLNADVDAGTGTRGELLVSGDEVGVQVRLEDMGDPQPLLGRDL